MNGDGASRSHEVTLPAPRPPDWEAMARYYHDLCLRLQRSAEAVERELPAHRPLWAAEVGSDG
jgi:hypothetical protein